MKYEDAKAASHMCWECTADVQGRRGETWICVQGRLTSLLDLVCVCVAVLSSPPLNTAHSVRACHIRCHQRPFPAASLE